MREETFDIVIVGAGPGGCACALSLKNSGLRVALIEKDQFPRDKICGDAIPGLAFKAMDKINPQWGQALKQLADKEDIKTAKIFAPNRKNFTLDWVTYAYNAKRVNFDTLLFDFVKTHTATFIFQNTRLQKVTANSTGVECHFQDKTVIKADLIIGCDGANSIVTRYLGNPNLQNAPSCAAVRTYYKGIEGLKSGINEFHFFKELLPGYFWIFPLENGWANVGFGILNSRVDQDKKLPNLRDTLKNITTTLPTIAPRFKNAELMDSIKGFALPLGTQRLPISGRRFMLCGDAASLIDPLQGHGIDHAMWSGILAANQAIDCFKKGDFDAALMVNYDKAVYKKLGSGLAISTFIMRIFSQFPFLLNIVSRMGQNKKLMHWMMRTLKI